MLAIIDMIAPHLGQELARSSPGQQLNNPKLLAKYGLAAGPQLPCSVSPETLTPRWSFQAH